MAVFAFVYGSMYGYLPLGLGRGAAVCPGGGTELRCVNESASLVFCNP